ncbi:MAG: iron-containing redox enzyme family protein [Gaiellaceae bacterium]
MPTASARLQRKLELIAPTFATPGRLLLEHPRAGELCPEYLASSTYVTLTTVPLMEAALERARALAAEDGVAAGLAVYLEAHIPEELHGGEPGRAALDDLDALGVDTDALVARPLPPQVAALIGSQFFWIQHRHPVAILGLVALEAFHPHAPTVERLIETTGLPRDGFRQLLLHAELDVAHAEELHRVIDALPLEPEHEELIGLSALHSMACLIDAWLDVVAAEDPVVVVAR